MATALDQQQFGTLVLILGDLHIPSRIPQFPQKLKSLFPVSKFSYVLSPGNFGSPSTYTFVKSLCPNLIAVKGDSQDPQITGLLQQKVTQIKSRKIGLIHGHQVVPCGTEQALYLKALEMGVSILISGHTHELKVSQVEGVTLINPGSFTGAYTPLRQDVASSFVVLEVKSKTAIVHGYEFVDGELRAGRYVIGAKEE